MFFQVCRASKQFLKLMENKAVIRIQDINPMLFSFVEELNDVKVNMDFLKSLHSDYYLGDNCIQYFHLGRYIVRYMVGNLVLRRHLNGVVKRDFRTYIRRYTSPNENFEYGYPHSNALLSFSLQKYSKNVLCCA